MLPAAMANASLNLHDPLGTLQRDLVALLTQAADGLGDAQVPLATRVHETRKRLKRARAWAQLLPAESAGEAERALRAVHRALGTRRDRDATLEAIARLLPRARRAGRDRARSALLAVRAGLTADPAAADAVAVDDARRHLQQLARTLSAREPGGDFSALVRGVVAIARRSRRTMRRALASGSPHDFHRWRKWMKYHWYHLRYLTPLWPELLRVEAAAAEHAAEWLGQSQDLELLRAAAAGCALDAAARHALQALLDREQGLLLGQAASTGLHLHAEGPRALGRRLRNYHKARRSAR